MSRLVVIGEVRAVHGLKGHFKITSYTQTPDDFFRFGPYRLGKDYANIYLKKIKDLKTGYVVSCDQINTRELAEKIVGMTIETDQSCLPQINKLNQFYYHQLINLIIKTEDGKNIGKVISVQNFGSSDLLEIRKKNRKDFFIPISDSTVKKVDLNKKIIIVKNINDYVV